MSAKDAFFQRVEENANAKKANEEALKNEMQAFQQETKALLQTIKSWFADSKVIAEISDVSIFEEGTRFIVPSILLRNGNKTLAVVPEGISYIGIHGVLKATISNPDRASRQTDFSLHWKDSMSNLPGWVIVAGMQRMEFNQENFFNQISSFA